MACLAQQLHAQDAGADSMRTIRGAVTYVTSSVVYGDLGRGNGLREGDTVQVLKDGAVTARLRVTHLASKSFSSEIIRKNAPIVRGDVLEAAVPPIFEAPRSELAEQALPTQERASREVTPVPTAPPALPPESNGVELRGRFSLQYHALYSSGVSGATFSQPAAVINLTADRLFEAPLRFSYYSNHRYDARGDSRRAGVARDRWRNRFYQFSLQYGSDEDTWSATAGRFIPYEIGGVGTLDGAMVRTRSGMWEVGAMAGSQPGYRNSELNFQDQKIAAYAGYRWEGENQRLRSNLAFAQNYRDGAVDRGYFYLVNVLSLGRDLNFYQNASLDLYDVDDGGGHLRPHLTDLYLSGTWRPERWLSLTGSYANRRSIYFLRSFASLPDSLFRPARLQNYQLSAGVNIPGGMYASATASLRTQDNSDQPAKAFAGRFTWSNVLSTRSNVYLLGSWADNIFNTSTSYGLEVSRDLIEGLYSSLRIQQFRYAYSRGDRSVDRTTLSLDAYYRLSRMFYLSLSYERYWEGRLTSDRIYSEVSMRLR